MPAHGLSMRKTREILRLRWGQGLGLRQVATSVRCSPSTVHRVTTRAQAAGLSWPLPDELDDDALEAAVRRPGASAARKPFAPLDCASMHAELSRRKGVTLRLLWLEYRARHPDDGCGYSRFCEQYRAWRKGLDVVMRQIHRAGDKMFVDYAGQTIGVTDPSTGEVTEYQVFVATLGASNYTYVEVHAAQDLRHWTMGHARAFEYFGGVTAVTVPDNLKSGVTKACFYEPDINPTYQELASHYDTVIIPARVRKPRDKAKVENAVLQAERWVLAPLRDRTFFSLEELRKAVAGRREWLNHRPLTGMGGATRRSLYESLDRPALKSLPNKRYTPSEWKTGVTVGIDYHVSFEGHFYSVPHALCRKRVDIRATATTLECFFKGKRVACHLRSYWRGKHTSLVEHMPVAHRRHAEWSPQRILRWASSVGEHTEALAKAIMDSRPHPEQGYRSCLGIIRLSKRYGKERLEAACARALSIRSFSYRSVDSILKAGLDGQPLPTADNEQQTDEPIVHANIRGADAYH